MAFFAYNKKLNIVESSPYPTADDVPTPIDAPGCSNRHDFESVVVLEYPGFDPDVDYVNCIKINAAGTALENPEKDKSFEDQKSSDATYRDSLALKTERLTKRQQIRSECANLIKETAWEDIKAGDTDIVNGNDAAIRALYQKRQAMRDQSNVAENALMAFNTLQEAKDYSASSKNWYTP